ncbi:MAG: UbiA family prenyltransferase [Acidobacteriota bacterium]
MATFLTRVRHTLDMIKFEHSIFALPFALTGALLAWRQANFPRQGTPHETSLHRHRHGRRPLRRDGVQPSPRRRHRCPQPPHQIRHLPAGLLSAKFAWGFIALWTLIFLAASAALNSLCLKLAPLALAIVMFYSYTKRFTHFAHLVLGPLARHCPAAAWIAMQGSLDPRILWLTAAVTLWTAGFDIIYSCQDHAFDVESGLHSIPRASASAEPSGSPASSTLGCSPASSRSSPPSAWALPLGPGSQSSPDSLHGNTAWSVPTISPESMPPSSP